LWQEDDSAGDVQQKRDTRNPCAGIPLRPERKRQVRLELSELPRLEAAIDAETTDPYLRAFFRFVLGTGCRRGEALNLRWEDVTLERKTRTVTFRDTKSGDDRSVPLSSYCARLLGALPKVEGNPFVFVGRRHGKRLYNGSKAWGRIRERAGLFHLRIHDLRRTFGSWLGDEGFSSKQIGTVLGHRSDITSRVYMALGDKSKRSAIDAMHRLMRKAKTRKVARRRSGPTRGERNPSILSLPSTNAAP
jgi:integrase